MGSPQRLISAGEENGVPLETGRGWGGGGGGGPPGAGKGASEPGWAVMNDQDAGVINMCTSQRTGKSAAQRLTKDALWLSLLGLTTKRKHAKT